MQYTGQVSISGSTQFPNIDCNVTALKAHPDNTDAIWVGNDGINVVSEDTGFPLSPGETVMIQLEGNLNNLYADADVANEKVCWIVVYK